MHAAIVELDALADAVRAAAEDHHLAAVARFGLVLRRHRPAGAADAGLVGRVHVRRVGGDLAGAGVDALVDRATAGGPAACSTPLLLAAEKRKTEVEGKSVAERVD